MCCNVSWVFSWRRSLSYGFIVFILLVRLVPPRIQFGGPTARRPVFSYPESLWTRPFYIQLVFKKHKSNQYQINTMHLYDPSNSRRTKTNLVKYSKLENLKILKFDMFEDSPKAPTSVFTKRYWNYLKWTSCPSMTSPKHPHHYKTIINKHKTEYLNVKFYIFEEAPKAPQLVFPRNIIKIIYEINTMLLYDTSNTEFMTDTLVN